MSSQQLLTKNLKHVNVFLCFTQCCLFGHLRSTTKDTENDYYDLLCDNNKRYSYLFEDVDEGTNFFHSRWGQRYTYYSWLYVPLSSRQANDFLDNGEWPRLWNGVTETESTYLLQNLVYRSFWYDSNLKTPRSLSKKNNINKDPYSTETFTSLRFRPTEGPGPSIVTRVTFVIVWPLIHGTEFLCHRHNNGPYVVRQWSESQRSRGL